MLINAFSTAMSTDRNAISAIQHITSGLIPEPQNGSGTAYICNNIRLLAKELISTGPTGRVDSFEKDGKPISDIFRPRGTDIYVRLHG